MHETEHFEIVGGTPLAGRLTASGAKNAALPIMAASLLTRGRTTLTRVPRLRDVRTMAAILRALGVRVQWTDDNTMTLEPGEKLAAMAPAELVHAMRGSICVLGPLLARRGSAAVSLPGGCVIGDRPIDLHLKGLRALGARIQEEKTSVLAHADRLRGARMDLSGEHGSTVTGTANVMMAATLAEGRTIIERAAREPEVQDLCHYLVACGARISGIGSSTLIIDGVPELHGVEHKVVPDRIETGTLLVAAAATRGSITVDEARPEDMGAVLECLRQAGARVSINGRSIHLTTPDPLRGVDVATAPHPGLPTDMQPQLSTLLCTVSARSIIREEVYPKRTTHVEFLREMGAKIRVYESQLIVDEGGPLQGATVRAKDLRAGAALVIAGLAADGTTTVTGLDQIDRGYQDLAPRLRAIGAEIHRVDPQAGRRTA